MRLKADFGFPGEPVAALDFAFAGERIQVIAVVHPGAEVDEPLADGPEVARCKRGYLREFTCVLRGQRRPEHPFEEELLPGVIKVVELQLVMFMLLQYLMVITKIKLLRH